MTLAYEQEGRDWRPELARLSPENEGWVSRQMELLELYMETLMKDCGEAGSSDESAEKKREHLQKEAGRLRVQELLAGFMSAPSMEVSRCYGRVSFSDDVTEVRMQPLAARLTARQLLDHHPLPRLCLMLFPGKRKLQDSGWIEGSIRLYGGRREDGLFVLREDYPSRRMSICGTELACESMETALCVRICSRTKRVISAATSASEMRDSAFCRFSA